MVTTCRRHGLALRRVLLVALTAAGLNCSAAPDASAWPEATASPDTPALARYRYSWVPAAPVPESPEHHASLLDQRLGAFATRVERARDEARLPPPVDFDGGSLADDIEELVESVEEAAVVSVHVRDLLSGETVFDHFGDKLLNAASNHKIVTASAAIDLLGPDYTFETDMAYADGALYVRGQGDPTLDEDGLGVLVRAALADVGDAPIERVVVDDSAFSRRYLAPGFDEGGVGVSYQAPSGALSLNFNIVEVIVYPVAGSKRPAVRVEPESTRVRIVNRARTSKRDALSVVSRWGTDESGPLTEIVVDGRVAPGGRARVFRRRVDDPGLFTGGAIAGMVATERGGEPPRVERGAFPTEPKLVAYRESVPVLEISGRVLAFSNNFIAEQLLRTLGWRLTGHPGDWDNGQDVLAGYWSALGQSMEDIHFENGSGMSREGRISAQALVDLIASAERGQDAGRSVLDALPVAGEEGTLRARLRTSGKRVRAKTGTLDGVSALSGIVSAEDGTPQVAFSIISNVREGETLNASARKRMEDRVVLALLGYLDDWELRFSIEILEAEQVRPLQG